MLRAAFFRHWGKTLEDLFREVDEDVRRDQYIKLWRAYGKYAIAIVIFIVALMGGYAAWREQQNRLAYLAADTYAQAVAQAREGKTADAITTFELIAKEAPAGYRALALLQAAGGYAAKGEFDKAVMTYDAIDQMNGIEPRLRELARVLAGVALVDRAPRMDVETRLKPIAESNSSWRFSAREILGLAALKAGDVAGARVTLTALADDQAAPANIRARATELIAATTERK